MMRGSMIIKILREKNFLSLSGNFIAALLGFVSFFILVRSLDTDPFGEWVLFTTAASLVNLLRLGITRVALTRFLSGANEEERKHFIGSSWLLGIGIIVVLAIPLYACVLLFPESIRSSGFYLFFIWYIPLSVTNLPWQNALSILQADEKFGKILFVRTFNLATFVIFLVFNYYLWRLSVEMIIIYHIVFNLATSLITSVFNWDGILFIFKAKAYTNKITLNFGKYAMGTSIGSSLLKSADAFIIGLSPFLGTTGVAIYSIPIKITEVIEILLRSFTATAFPKLSKASIEDNKERFRTIFNQYSGALTILLIPFILICSVFPREFVFFFG